MRRGTRADSRGDASTAKKPRTEHASVAPSLVESSSLLSGAVALDNVDSDVVLIRRPPEQCSDVLQCLQEYLSTDPVWPDTEDYHPLEATHDRVALIDFKGVPFDTADPLAAAIAMGRNLPRRGAAQSANAYRGVAEVVSVLPIGSGRDGVARDAEELLRALWKETRATVYQVRLELVRGDTCQKWHRDTNTLRSIVTYVGPGTIVADEAAVERESDGSVVSVVEKDPINQGLVKQAMAGDFVLMKGGLYPGSGLRGAAHKAPPIGPVGLCGQKRIMLKVDILSDLQETGCSNCTGH